MLYSKSRWRRRHQVYAAAIAALVNFLLGATLVAAECSQNEQSTWSGMLQTPSAELPLIFTVSHDSKCGANVTVISVAQGNAKIWGDGIWSSASVDVAFDGIKARFVGASDSDGQTIRGTWSQQGADYSLDLHLTTKDKEMNPDQLSADDEKSSMLRTSLYKNRFNIVSHTGVTLAVVELRALSAQNTILPGVVIASGSGPQAADGLIAGKPIYRELAEHLARAGFSVFRFDERGTGSSSGDYWTADFESLTDDLCAVVERARQTTGVDSKNTAIIGHSAGAISAAACAKRLPDVKALIMLAPPGQNAVAIANSQFDEEIRAVLPDADDQRVARGLQHAMLGVVQNSQKTGENLLRELQLRLQKETAKQSLNEKTLAIVEELTPNLPALSTPAMATFLRVDPRLEYEKIPSSMHIVVIFGSKDCQVLPSENLPMIREALKEKKYVKIEVIDNHNHIFQYAPGTGSVAEYALLEGGVSDIALRVIEKATRRALSLI